MIHPISFFTLLNFVENTLPAEARAAVEAHLAEACAQCQTNLARARGMLEALRANDETVAPPADVVRRAVAAFRPPAAPSVFRRVVAALLFDNFRQSPLAAVRGAARLRQLLFAAEGLDIDVQIKDESDGTTLMGQILGPESAGDPPTSFVRLYHAGEILDVSETDTLGRFAFRAVPPGAYDLGVQLASHEILLEGLELDHD